MYFINLDKNYTLFVYVTCFVEADVPNVEDYTLIVQNEILALT